MHEATKAKDFQLLDHGIDHAQYFQGCGVAFTDYRVCFTGCGSNCAEAVEDCLEQIAMDGSYDVKDLEERIKAEYLPNGEQWPLQPNTDEFNEENEESEMYYYASIRRYYVSIRLK
jgi:hypothetical protein